MSPPPAGLASQYLAAWIIAHGASLADAEAAIHYVAPVGEKSLYLERALATVSPFLGDRSAHAA